MDEADWRTELILRGIAAASYAASITVMIARWQQAGRPFGLLPLIAIEGFTLVLILVARPARRRDMSWTMMASAVFTSFFYPLLVPVVQVESIATRAFDAVAVAGVLLMVCAKLSLGRSFGILPAARGLQVRGAYRWVRHPMYLGYLMTNAGFLFANPGWRNALVMALLWGVQLVRIQREEAVIADSFGEAWTGYAAQVRYRLLPGVY
jgi:protein-S-isoprenylcysteine O-methyltransferase Ste14